MRIVLNANVFVSAAISPHGACGKILQTILHHGDEFELISTQRIIVEIIESLSKPRIIRYSKKSNEVSKAWIEDISATATIVPDIQISFTGCRDPDDIVHLAAADVAKANFIVSGDKDLLVLKRFREVDIISPTEFIYLLKQLIPY